MSYDSTESLRMSMSAAINANASARAELEAREGQVWDTDELSGDFDVIGFGAPLVVVVRKADRVKGSLFFQHHPRFYYGFQPA